MNHLSDFSKLTAAKDQHSWVHLSQFGIAVCAGCGINRDISTSFVCIPIYPRPDIEAMKSIGRNTHGN